MKVAVRAIYDVDNLPIFQVHEGKERTVNDLMGWLALRFGFQAGRSGELTHDEATIINGAIDLTEKTAGEAMTPIESIFSLDANSKLNW